MAEVEISMGFPVVFYDGENKTTFGNIYLNPLIDFKEFRTILSEMIGVSHNNVTTYLIGLSKNYTVCYQRERRKIVITSKIDFSDLVQDVECAYFLVVLKPSRRERRKKSKQEKDSVEDELLLPKNLFDLCFDQYREIAPQMVESDKAEIWLQEMQNANNDMDENCGSVAEAYPKVDKSMNRPLCVKCEKGNRKGFKDHLCNNDTVFEGFLGPSLWDPLCVDDMAYPKVDKSMCQYDEMLEPSSWGPLCVDDMAYPKVNNSMYQYDEVLERSLDPSSWGPLCVDDMAYAEVDKSMYQYDEVFEGYVEASLWGLLCVDDMAYPEVDKSMYQYDEVFERFLVPSSWGPISGPLPKKVSDYIWWWF